MLTVKVLGCLLLLISPTIAGFLYGDRFKNRVSQLKEIQRSIYQLQNEIIYTHTPLPQAFNNVSNKSTKPISDIFMDASKLLEENKVENVYEGFLRTIENNKDVIDLEKEDIDIILDLAKSLGNTDIEGQKSVFSLAINTLKKHIEVAELLCAKNVKMYRYLGFSVGAVLAILCI